MLRMFDDETNVGKLYINYPMIESIRYTNQLPDADFWKYTVTRDKCKIFKGLAAEFSAYGSLDFILLDKRKEPSEDKLASLRQNWELLRQQHVSKANYLCSGLNSMPDNKDIISQQNIFNVQLEKYVIGDICQVSILNSFPIFLYEYFK